MKSSSVYIRFFSLVGLNSLIFPYFLDIVVISSRESFDFKGHGNHGVHLCHKCGWPFPNPHPSAKHRRAHKKICGTIEGHKLFDSEEATHLNASDDEHLSDDDHKTPGELPPKFLIL